MRWNNKHMPQFYLLNSLARQIKRFPALRDTVWGVEAALLERIWHLVETRDPDSASSLGERVGRLFGPLSHKHKHILTNLRTAFPDWLPHQVDDMAVRVWGQFGRVIAEFPFLRRIGDPGEGRMRVVDLGGTELVLTSGRPGIFVSAHLANWNLPGVAAARFGIPLTAVYSRDSNPFLEAKMAEWRAAIGCGFLDVKLAGRQLLRELQQGRSLGLLVDQRFDKGEKMPFFGVPATTSTSPARLALQLDLPLIPVRVQRLESARFVITVHRPIPPERDMPEDEAARRMTTRVNELFARWIAEAPEQWLCVKRRWPRVRLQMPKRGKVSTA
jgi:Kdo2-lipid IVA lauroyltransferase/acyltransferase